MDLPSINILDGGAKVEVIYRGYAPILIAGADIVSIEYNWRRVCVYDKVNKYTTIEAPSMDVNTLSKYHHIVDSIHKAYCLGHNEKYTPIRTPQEVYQDLQELGGVLDQVIEKDRQQMSS